MKRGSRHISRLWHIDNIQLFQGYPLRRILFARYSQRNFSDQVQSCKFIFLSYGTSTIFNCSKGILFAESCLQGIQNATSQTKSKVVSQREKDMISQFSSKLRICRAMSLLFRERIPRAASAFVTPARLKWSSEVRLAAGPCTSEGNLFCTGLVRDCAPSYE